MDEPTAEASQALETPPKRGRGNPNLAAAREKALETRQKKALVTKAAKLQKKQVFEEEYAKAKQFLEPDEPKAEPIVVAKKPPRKTRTKVIELTDSSSSSSSSEEEESDSDSDSTIEEVRVVRKPRAPKPKASKHEEDMHLTGAVARDMLRTKLFKDAEESAIRMLFPNWRG
jgi:hypothetical protein